MRDAAQPGNLLRLKIKTQKIVKLCVPVLLHDVNALVRVNEIAHSSQEEVSQLHCESLASQRTGHA